MVLWQNLPSVNKSNINSSQMYMEIIYERVKLKYKRLV